jgi:predicted dehydrogenase
MAVNSDECREMIAACAKAGVKLMIAYRCQYEPHNRAVIKLARSGEFGRPRLIQAFNGQTTGLPEQWRLRKALAGGGSLPDIGLYCLNTARAVLGEEPNLIQAQIHSPPDDPKYREVEETASFTLHFPSGVIAQCLSSYGVYEARSLTLHTGTASVDLQNAFAYQGQRLYVGHRDGKNAARDEKVLSPKNQFALELDHFARCIQENLRPRTPGEEGLQDQVLMEAIYEAARTGTPVKVGPPPGAGSGLDVTRGPEPEEPG